MEMEKQRVMMAKKRNKHTKKQIQKTKTNMDTSYMKLEYNANKHVYKC